MSSIRKLQEADVKAIVAMYGAAFAGFPWFENLSISVVNARWKDYASKSGFECFVFESNNQLAGAIWWDWPDIAVFRKDRGDKLADFYQINFPKCSLAWERDIIVSPLFQGKGIATQLRKFFISQITSFQRLVVILTRMRDDNIGTIKIAEKLDFFRTGIRVSSSANPLIFHEYWYRLVDGGA